MIDSNEPQNIIDYECHPVFSDENLNKFDIACTLLKQSPEPVLRWVGYGFENYRVQQLMEDIPPKPIDFYLGLSAKTGQFSTPRKLRYQTRNYHLHAAIQILKQKHRCTIWEACGLLINIIIRNCWLKNKVLNEDIQEIDDPVKYHFFEAKKTGLQIELSQISLKRIFDDFMNR